MKIRTGFVSNSSSSSFCIIGIQIDRDKLIKKIKNDLTKEELEAVEDGDYDRIYNWAEKKGLDCHYDDYDTYYIGSSILDIGGDQTLNEFKKQVKSLIGFLKDKEDVEFIKEVIPC